MKLSLEKVLPTVSNSKEDEKIFYAYTHKPIKLPHGMLRDEIICPECGCKSGNCFQPVGSDFKMWFCTDCCDKYAKKPSARNFHQPKLSPSKQLQSIGIPADLLQVEFSKCDAFAIKGKSSAALIEHLSKWARRPFGFVLFAGNSGKGKTYASCCVLSMAVKCGVPDAYFINVSDLYIRWKDSFNAGASELHILTSLGDKKLLVIDDIGVRTPTEGFLEFIYLLLSKRMSGDKGTIITTNLTGEQMYEKLGDALSSRICGGEIIVFEGPDRRKKLGF